MEKATVSVIVPCFNAASTVAEAVGSAIAQTFDTVDVICVDDGSTDQTRHVLRRLKEAHGERVQIVEQPNNGACAARNAGLLRAKGEYVQFLDSDDILLPDKVAHQIQVAREHVAPDIIVGSYVHRHLDGSERVVTAEPANPWVALPQVKLGITSANLYRLDAVLRVDGWDEHRRSSQEYDLMFRMLKSGSRVAFDARPLTIIRKTEGSITMANREADTARRLEHVAELRDYLRLTGNDPDALLAAETALFDVVRSLCKWNIERGVEAFHRFFQPDYRPTESSGTTGIYVAAYTMLGFRRAEQLRTSFRRLRRVALWRSRGKGKPAF